MIEDRCPGRQTCEVLLEPRQALVLNANAAALGSARPCRRPRFHAGVTQVSEHAGP